LTAAVKFPQCALSHFAGAPEAEARENGGAENNHDCGPEFSDFRLLFLDDGFLEQRSNLSAIGQFRPAAPACLRSSGQRG
jgi:hypothetical protein